MHLQTEMDSSHQDYVSPIPEFKPPVEPQLFRLDETPYMSIVDDILNRHNLDRPSSRLTKYQHLFFVQILTQFLGPLFLTVTFICNIVRYTNGHSDMTWNELIILTPIIVTLPMVSLSFPIYWLFANYVALGMFGGTFSRLGKWSRKILFDYLFPIILQQKLWTTTYPFVMSMSQKILLMTKFLISNQ